MSTKRATMNILVKMLNGDLIAIKHHPLLDGETVEQNVQRFVQKVYDACPSIPLGCLVIRRDDGSVVTNLAEGDIVFALVDTSLVEPVVYLTPRFVQVNNSRTYAEHIRVHFFKKDDSNLDEDGFRLSMCTVDILSVERRARFALMDTLKAGMGTCIYEETPKTQWFPSITDCLMSVDQPRFPTDEVTMEKVNESFGTIDE